MAKPSLQYRAFTSLNKKAGFLEFFQKTDLNIPPIFIIGPPRSGSTLFYQVLVSGGDFSYLSNAHCRFFGMPWLFELFSNYRKHYQENVSFESNFGGTREWFEPSECGNFWYRFFSRNKKFSENSDISSKNISSMQQSVGILQSLSGKPLVTKNLMNTFRLEPLSSAFPNAIFIVIKRDVLDNAHSLLEARFKMRGNYTDWFSTEPKNLQELKSLPPEQQVVEQIRESYRYINEIKNAVGINTYEVSYEKFCDSPHDSLIELQTKLKAHQVNFNIPNNFPDRFRIRSEIRIPEDLYDNLQNYINSSI